MRSEVKIVFSDGAVSILDVLSRPVMTSPEGRQWLDQQFVDLDCEPIRASGKVLIADKVLVVASTAGPSMFANANWAAYFAQATLAA